MTGGFEKKRGGTESRHDQNKLIFSETPRRRLVGAQKRESKLIWSPTFLPARPYYPAPAKQTQPNVRDNSLRLIKLLARTQRGSSALQSIQCVLQQELQHMSWVKILLFRELMEPRGGAVARQLVVNEVRTRPEEKTYSFIRTSK